MVFANLRREERIGLGIALALHVALAAALLVQPNERASIPPPEKMTVNLTSDVGLEAAAPEPVAESAASIAPVIAPEPARPAEPEVAVAPRPEPARPAATSAARPRPVPTVRPSSKPAPRPTASAPSRPRPAGASRIGADFLDGVGESTATRETRVPASQIGASAKASIVQAISRQLKPKWQGRAPEGPDAEKLITILAFNLDPDGSLVGVPRVVRQEGLNELNRKQAALHAEAAIKAVQLAAPFDLPEEHYEAWKRVSSFRFDRKL